MTSLMILEILGSLSVQVTLLICMVSWLVRREPTNAAADWCWAAVHVCILGLTAAAFLAPHLRLVTWADVHPAPNPPLVNAAFSILGRFCTWAWISGALAIFAVGVGGMIRATLLVRDAAIDDELKRSLQQSVPELESLGRTIKIRVLPGGISPFCWQLHQPVIALPELVSDFPVNEQAAIVRHELAHLRLQHPLHLFLQRIVEAIYWYHPLVWWASRQAAAAREFRCDREAVKTQLEVAVYLRSLLRLIESRLKPQGRLPAGLGFLGDASLLGRRAEALVELLDRPREAERRLLSAISISAAVLVCLLIWMPVNPQASRRESWSPWPQWSAKVFDAAGYHVRDFEADGYRLRPHEYGQRE